VKKSVETTDDQNLQFLLDLVPERQSKKLKKDVES